MNIPPLMISMDERVAMGQRCKDADSVPKVADAGTVFEDSKGRRLQIMHNGLRVLCDGYYGGWMTNLIRQGQGHHEPQEERLFHEVVSRLPDTANMIELGGFWSYYSLWFLQHHPQRQSVVIEPEPTHLEVGRTNAALNNLSPVFKAGFAGTSYAASAPFQGEASGHFETTQYSVAHLMQEQRWDKLSLLHCDIQGHEVAVLESCRSMFEAGKIDWVFVSTHAHNISNDPLTHQHCLSILRDCGAFIEVEHDVHESFSGDGLIVARFGPAPDSWKPVTLSANRHSTSLFRSLAYDLDEKIKAEAKLAPLEPLPRNVHPTLRKRGMLYELAASGPLGPKGSTLLLRDDAVMSPAIVSDAAWEVENIHDFVSHLKPKKRYTLVDIGANVGLFCRQLCTVCDQIDDAHCVEPERENFQALRYNLGFLEDRVHLHNVALGDADMDREFFRDADNVGNYSLNQDAMRARQYDSVDVSMRDTETWMTTHLAKAEAIAWKSDTQGFDEVIISRTPMEVWDRIDVAIIEVWRIEKPDFDAEALRRRLEAFPNRQLGDATGVSVDDIFDYLSGNDWEFKELLLWR